MLSFGLENLDLRKFIERVENASSGPEVYLVEQYNETPSSNDALHAKY